jgi:acyl-CoA thioesterase-1
MWSGGRLRLRYCVRYWAGLVLACGALAACGRTDAAPARAAAASEAAAAAPADERPVVLCLGTSLTAGYGLPLEQAFPALVQQRIDAAGLDYRVVNAGVSGDTSAGGRRRIDWLLRLPVAVLVLELGANDMLRGQDPVALRENLQAIVDRTRAAHPDARLLVAGMRAAPNLGARYARAFDAVYPELARANAGVLLPFLLDGVAGDPALNQLDGIHPTAEGHRRIAEALWRTLAPLL